MTLSLENFAEKVSKIPLSSSQKRFLEQYEKARKENYVILTTFPRCNGRNMLRKLIAEYERGGSFAMDMGQFNRANQIRGRIRELKILLENIKRNGDDTDIDGYKIPKNSKDVLQALCQKEIDELEQEFNDL